MPTFSGFYEYLVAGRGAERHGPAELAFDAERVTLVPVDGPPLTFDLGDVERLSPGERELLLVLDGGDALRLHRFAKAASTLEHDLTVAWRDRVTTCLLARDLDEVGRFDGRIALASSHRAGEGAAEIRLHASNLVVLPTGPPGFHWRLSDIDTVSFEERDYAVVLATAEATLRVSRLAKRTREFEAAVSSCLGALREREASTLHALFPFLQGQAFQEAASLMREGSAVPVDRLRRLHPLVEPTLLERLPDAPLGPYVHALVERAVGGRWFLGRKLITAEEARRADEPSDGTATSESLSTADPEVGAGPSVGWETGAAAGPPQGVDAGDGLEMAYWALVPAGHGTATRVAWESLTHGGRATYVFAAGGDEASVRVLNRALVEVNLRREPVYLPDTVLETDARYRHYAIATRRLEALRGARAAFRGRAIHTSPAGWQRQLEGLLA